MKSFLHLKNKFYFLFLLHKLFQNFSSIQFQISLIWKIHFSIIFNQLILIIAVFLFLPIFDSYLFAKELKGETILKSEKNYELILVARRFAQGEVILVKIHPKKKAVLNLELRLNVDGKEISLSTVGIDRIGFIPISPEHSSKVMVLELFSKILFVKYGSKKYEIEIQKTDFIVIKKQSLRLDHKYTDKVLPEKTLKFIELCSLAKNKAFSSNTKLQFIEGFDDPVKNVHLTSPFYVRRDYNNQKGRPHGGLDYRGNLGNPIYAIQDGTVVLAKEMYYEGYFTIIDHGNRIFSFYMHQSEIVSKVGDKIKKGDLIGRIGSTGMSTGSHLHLGIKINDSLVNPESILFFRNL